MSSLQLRAQAALLLRERRQKAKGDSINAPKKWDEWLRTIFPRHFSAEFAQRHIDLWSWAESVNQGVRPPPFCGFWGRGGAKSTNAEGVAVRFGARKIRRYCWYISGTQDKADSHVENIAGMLESSRVSEFYPELSSRMLGKYGSSKGWRHNRLRTESGFTVDSLGLDTGSRGVKIEDARPDLMIFDDFDDLHDTIAATQKKKQTITQSILPSGSTDCAVLVIQNLIHAESIASMLADGRADFLIDRIVSGPHPAVEGLTYEQRNGKFWITGGKATWAGQSLEICQQQMDTWGLTAFLQESQHDVERTGGLWDHIEFQHVTKDKLPRFVRTSVWVDPAVTSTDKSDSMGISAGGIDEHDMITGLYWWENITSPEDALNRAIRKAVEIGSPTVGVETDQGGDTWRSVFARALEEVKRAVKIEMAGHERDYNKIIWPTFIQDKAGAGYGPKGQRNAQMLVDYENGKVQHMTGTHIVIEKALRRFPNKPLDVADSHWWMWNDLRNGGEGGFVDNPMLEW